MKTSLFVATPCYGGQISLGYFRSMLQLQSLCSQNKIPLEIFNIPFESLIPRARNASIARFMTTEHTHLMFIDADIEFDAHSVLHLISSNKDIICGIYPKKVLDFKAISEHSLTCASNDDFIVKGAKYAYNPIDEPLKGRDSAKTPEASRECSALRSHFAKRQVESTIIEVKDAATGFMMIQRHVIEKMIQAYPDTEYANDVNAYQLKDARFYDLFQSGIFDGRYLSEDYGFCRLWQNMGHSVFVDLSIKLNHIGTFRFIGNPLQSL